jgi:hypothetical protein
LVGIGFALEGAPALGVALAFETRPALDAEPAMGTALGSAGAGAPGVAVAADGLSDLAVVPGFSVAVGAVDELWAPMVDPSADTGPDAACAKSPASPSAAIVAVRGTPGVADADGPDASPSVAEAIDPPSPEPVAGDRAGVDAVPDAVPDAVVVAVPDAVVVAAAVVAADAGSLPCAVVSADDEVSCEAGVLPPLSAVDDWRGASPFDTAENAWPKSPSGSDALARLRPVCGSSTGAALSRAPSIGLMTSLRACP